MLRSCASGACIRGILWAVLIHPTIGSASLVRLGIKDYATELLERHVSLVSLVSPWSRLPRISPVFPAICDHFRQLLVSVRLPCITAFHAYPYVKLSKLCNVKLDELALIYPKLST